MEIMYLTPEIIAYAKKEIDFPQYFEETEKVTPKHLLFKEFTEKTKWHRLPKIIFYICMDELFPKRIGKEHGDRGDLGYSLKIKNQPDEKTTV